MITISETGLYVDHVYTPILLAVGSSGYTEEMHCPWCRDLFIQADVTGLGSGDSIDLTVEGSLDREGWDNLDATGLATAINSNGCTILKFSGALPPYVRVGVTGATGVLEDATVQLQAYIAIIS